MLIAHSLGLVFVYRDNMSPILNADRSPPPLCMPEGAALLTLLNAARGAASAALMASTYGCCHQQRHPSLRIDHQAKSCRGLYSAACYPENQAELRQVPSCHWA